MRKGDSEHDFDVLNSKNNKLKRSDFPTQNFIFIFRMMMRVAMKTILIAGVKCYVKKQEDVKRK